MYNHEEWRERIRNRSDMSTYLTHLTKASEGNREGFPTTAIENLLKILQETKLKASSKGFINGGTPVVCFQDAPLYGISQNVKYEMINKRGDRNRYEPIGICIPKRYIFNQGGRPVIYEKPERENDKNTFPSIGTELLWRVVSMDLTDPKQYTDWTHEREWRIKGDVEFTLDTIYILLADYKMYQEFISKVEKEILEQVNGIIVLESIMY